MVIMEKKKKRRASLIFIRGINFSFSLHIISMFVKTMTPKKMDSAQRGGVSFPHACQSTSMFSHRLWYNLLMQLSSAFFFHGNALTNVSLVCGHQTGESIIMEPETWPDYMFCKQSQCSHELFNWCVRLGSHHR